MREILFRGKCIKRDGWAYGEFHIDDICRATIEIPRNKHTDKSIPRVSLVSLETVGQYTGVTDKNDKKIFEGDIVAFTFHSDLAEHACLEERPEITENHVILFHDGSFWMKRIVVPDSLTAQLYGGRIVLESLWKHRIEVIGNIYDNPELTKGESK